MTDAAALAQSVDGVNLVANPSSRNYGYYYNHYYTNGHYYYDAAGNPGKRSGTGKKSKKKAVSEG